MADSGRELFRSGQISPKAWDKLKQFSGQRDQPTKMAPFHGKGSRDEGGVRDRGDRSVASSRHIDQNQDIAPRPLAGNRVTGRPSRGTAVNSGVGKNTRSFDRTGGSVPRGGMRPGRNEIDQGEMQRPEFPAGSRVKRQPMGGASNRMARGRIPAQGGQYGGGGQGTQ